MADRFYKNELCDPSVFDDRFDATNAIPTNPEDSKFLNLNKTVKLVSEALKMNGDVPRVYVHAPLSPAFAVHSTSNSLHITQGLYNRLDNEQLRTIMILQTCLTHRAHEYEGRYHAAAFMGMAGGVAVGSGISLAAIAASNQALGIPNKKSDDAPDPGRRAVLKAVLGAAVMAVPGALVGKHIDDAYEYKNWVQAAVADYATLNDDGDKTKLLGALIKINQSLARQAGKHEIAEQSLAAIGQFMHCAITATPNKQLTKLPTTVETREYAR